MVWPGDHGRREFTHELRYCYDTSTLYKPASGEVGFRPFLDHVPSFLFNSILIPLLLCFRFVFGCLFLLRFLPLLYGVVFVRGLDVGAKRAVDLFSTLLDFYTTGDVVLLSILSVLLV